MEESRLKEILKKHLLWLNDEEDGEKADLHSADLCDANLYGADLRGADLCGANLHSADLRGANLHSANLCDANGINKYLITPLLLLLDQPGKIIAYKIVNAKNTGIYFPGIYYKIGETFEEKNANCYENEQCGSGISLATLDWCIKEWKPGRKILMAEFEAKDIAAIPIGTDGKFRVFRCKIVGEKDLKSIGLID